MAPRVETEVLCFRLFCVDRSVTEKSRGKPAKVFLVKELGEVAVGLVLGRGEGVQDGALRLERLGSTVSLHGLRGSGGARGSGSTRGEETGGTTSAPANAPNVDGETNEGAINVATDAVVPRATAVERACSMDRRRLGGSVRRGGGRGRRDAHCFFSSRS